MTGFLGLSGLTLFIVLIIGLVKPALVLRWSEKPTRLKVVGYWVLSVFITVILGAIFIDDSIDSKSNIKNAKNYIKEGDYSNAISSLKKIEEKDSLYNTAKLLLKKTDSLSNLSEEEKKTIQELITKKSKEKEVTKQKEQLERELKSIDNGVKIAESNSIEGLQIDIVLFASWAKMIKDAEESQETEIKNLGKKLKSKVANIQDREFPNLRRKYTDIVAKKMWENDIEVSANGTGKKYINFTGGIFAMNKNKKDFQGQVHEILTIFRFKQSRYRWYKGEDEYTYYTIYEGKDSDPVTFDK